MNTHSLRLRGFSAVAVLLCLPAALTGCGATPTGSGDLARAKEIKKTCPKDKKVAGKAALDASGSGRTPEIGPERITAIASLVRRVAICSGHIKVSMFAATSAATVVLLDRSIQLPGATTNAQLRHVQKTVDEIVRTVADAYKAGLPKLSPNGSDVLAEYQDAAAYIGQLGSGYKLEVLILSDGYQAAGGINMGGAALTESQAKALVARIDVPKLPKDASVVVAGIGRVSVGKPASSAVVDGTIRFWQLVCAKSAAASCLSVTDYTTSADR